MIDDGWVWCVPAAAGRARHGRRAKGPALVSVEEECRTWGEVRGRFREPGDLPPVATVSTSFKLHRAAQLALDDDDMLRVKPPDRSRLEVDVR